jgi:hypothetical protein
MVGFNTDKASDNGRPKQQQYKHTHTHTHSMCTGGSGVWTQGSEPASRHAAAWLIPPSAISIF